MAGLGLCLMMPCAWGETDYADAQLLGYVQRVLVASDEARMLGEDLELGHYVVENEQARFHTLIRPIANLAVDSSTRPRTGVEFSRHTRYGVDLSAGYATDGFGNSASARSFARIGVPLMQRFGREQTELPLTRAQIQRERLALDANRRLQRLVAQAVDAHVALVLTGELEAQAEQSLSRAAQHVEAARARQRVGLVSKVDVHRAELGRLDREQAYELARHTSRMQREEYAELGRLEPAHVHVPARLPVLDVSSTERFTPPQRVEWHMQQLDERLARLDLQAAERRLQPDLKLEVAWLGTDYGGGFDAYVRDQSDVFVSLRLDSDLDFGSKRRAIAAQKIAYERVRRGGQALARQLEREARQANANLRTLSRRHELAALRRTEAAQALDVAQVRFDRGIASNLDVVDAEAALSDAELSELQAEAGRISAIVDLALTRGELTLAWLQDALRSSERTGAENEKGSPHADVAGDEPGKRFTAEQPSGFDVGG